MIGSLRIFGFLLLIILFVAIGGTSHTPISRITGGSPSTATACEIGAHGFTTWAPAEKECPICKTKNTFMVWMSFGTYIYQWPSKYQLIYWPFTDSQAWYSCKKCRYTAYIGHFDNVPKEKIPELQKMLAGVSLPPQKEQAQDKSRELPPYLSIPVSDRLSVVEKVDRVLGRTSDDELSHFYRVLAYHLAAEKKQAAADEARRKVLAITERQLKDPAKDGERKQLLYISGAMHHFLHEDAPALKDFAAAKTLTFLNKELKEEQNKGYNEYLSHLIDEYIEMINKGKGPSEDTESGFLDEQ
jgi:hypothetical protein